VALRPVRGRETAVGYQLFDQLSKAGTATAYVDLDQLGLCRPAPEDDPHNNRAKARNLAAVWSGFRAAGAQCLVVSGIVDDAQEVRRHADLLPDTALPSSGSAGPRRMTIPITTGSRHTTSAGSGRRSARPAPGV